MVRLDPWGRCCRGRLAHPGWLVPAACFWVSPLLAQPKVRQECKSLSPEDSAQVETRLLAGLLARQAPDVDVSITCDSSIALVSASVGPPEARRSIALSGTIAPEAILSLAGRALAQLLATPEAEATAAASAPTHTVLAEPATADARSPQSAAPSEVSSTSLPAPAPPSSEPTAPAQTPIAYAAGAHHASRVRADVAVQSWGSHAAAGVALGLEQASGSFTYAFLAGGAWPFRGPSLSDVAEWTAAGELGWQRQDSLGLRISARLGLSLLTLSPQSGVAASSGTLKSAGFLELDVSRPIWLGRFGLAPGLGLRAFSAKREVTVEGEPELQLSTPSAHAFLSFLLRISE